MTFFRTEKVPGDRTSLDQTDLGYKLLLILSPLIPKASELAGIQILQANSGAVYIFGQLRFMEKNEYLDGTGCTESLDIKKLPFSPGQLEELIQVIKTETTMTPEQVYSRANPTNSKRLELAIVGKGVDSSSTPHQLYASLPRSP